MKRIFYLVLLALAACSSTSSDTQPPATPTNLVATAGDASVTLAWTASTDADLKGYNLYWGRAANALSDSAFVDKASTSKTVSGLSNDTPYFFAVDAEDASGNTSAKTQLVSATPEAPLPDDTTLPVLVSSTPANDASEVPVNVKLALVFSEAMDEEALELTSNPPITFGVATWQADKTGVAFANDDLTASTSYTLTVKAKDVAGNALAQTTISFTTSDTVDTTAPSTPTGLVAKAADGQVTLTWTANPETDVAGYTVYVGTAEDALEPGGSVTEATKTVTGLTNGTKYFFAVDAVDAAGNTSPKTEVVSATPVASSPTLTVGISSPSGTVHTNGALTIQVVVSGGTPDSVELLKDDAVLVGNLTAPYTYTWDTSSEAEGSYSLKARASKDGKVFESEEAVTVVVDRTAPTITERTPAPGADNVLYSDPITIKFSEPMLASTVTSANVQLEANNLPVPFTSSLADDGLTLTLQAAEGGITEFDTQPELTLSNLSDKAGNELSVSSWGWTLPSWLTVGGSRVNDLEDSQIIHFSADSLELDAANHPVVVVNEIEQIADDKGPLYVKRWTGTEWQRLGDNLAEGSGSFVTPNALAIDGSGNPVVAFNEATTGSFQVRVQQWDGSSWQPIGSSLNQNPERWAFPLSLSLDASGNPVLAFGEWTNNARPFKMQLYVKRWTGSSWELVGTGSLNQNTDFDTDSASLALDASGQPVVAWNEYDDNKFLDEQAVYVKRWTGTAWQLVGSGKVNTLKLGFGPSLVLDASGRPTVAFVEKSDAANPGFVYVKKFDGAAWQNVGSSVNPVSELTENAANVSLALDTSARLVVRYLVSASGGGYDTHFKRFEGSSWQPLAKPIEAAYSATLALDELGNPFTAITRTSQTPTLSTSAFVLEANH